MTLSSSTAESTWLDVVIKERGSIVITNHIEIFRNYENVITSQSFTRDLKPLEMHILCPLSQFMCQLTISPTLLQVIYVQSTSKWREFTNYHDQSLCSLLLPDISMR